MDQQTPQAGLVKGLKNASFEAWRGLHAQFGGVIYRLALGMVGAADAEDVAQEAFLQAFRKRHQFRGECAKEFEAWLCRITVNKCKDWRRRRQARPVCVAVSNWDEVGATEYPVESRLDDRDLLQEGLQHVTPHLRTLLLLHLAGRSYREICRITKIKSIGTVSERLGLAREQLREALARLGWRE